MQQTWLGSLASVLVNNARLVQSWIQQRACTEDLPGLSSSLNPESLCARLGDQILVLEVLVNVDSSQRIQRQLTLGELLEMLRTQAGDYQAVRYIDAELITTEAS